MLSLAGRDRPDTNHVDLIVNGSFNVLIIIRPTSYYMDRFGTIGFVFACTQC